MSNAAEWTEADQLYSDFVSELACEISADEDVVGDVLATLKERGLFKPDAAIARERIVAAFGLADGDLNFVVPLRFEYAQGSDQTGEYYTTVAKFVDATGTVIMDITCNGDWVDTQMHAVAALLTAARQALETPDESQTAQAPKHVVDEKDSGQ